jgi:membrane protein YqaA with SNARE-associated domain
LIHKLASLLLHWKLILLALLKPLGFWGIGILAAIDTSSLAIPMDLIVAGYVWSDRSHFWLYALMAALGAAFGALVPFYIGRTGGEWVLLQRMERAKYDELNARFQKYHWFAVMVPAAMPPPFPFKLFAFGAGVFDMRVLPYLTAVFTGRAIHYMVLALLVMRFGPQIVSMALDGMKHHAVGIGVGFAGLVLILAALWMLRKKQKRVPLESV